MKSTNIPLTMDIICFSMYSIFSSMVFETPILVIFFLNKGLNYSQIATIFSVYAITVFVLEYITGILADRFSRILCLIAGCISLVCGELILIWGSHYFEYISAICLIALYVALRSGTDTALIYDKLKELNHEPEYSKFISVLRSITLFTGSIAFVFGGLLIKIGNNVPLWCTISLHLISLLMLCLIKEPKINRTNISSSSEKIFKKTISLTIQSKAILAVILLSTVLFSSANLINWITQPYLKSLKIEINYFGVFYMLFSISQSIGAFITSKIINIARNNYNVLIQSAFAIVFLSFLFSIPYKGIAFFIFIAIGISYGIYYTVDDIVFNHLIESDVRAAMLSLQHGISKILQAVLFIIAGVALDLLPLNHVMFCVSIFFLTSVCFINFLFYQNFMKLEVKKKTI